MIYIIIGVSGSGKTTIGRALSKKLDLAFYDADDFHPPQNVIKLKGGIALTDEDRMPWLNLLVQQMPEWQQQGGAVLACSALKENYRRILDCLGTKEVQFIFLNADKSIIKSRLESRKDHFFNPALLESQFTTLEIPEYGIHIENTHHPDEIMEQIMEKVGIKAQLGIIGLGVMGKSLALNFAGRKNHIAIYNRHVPGKEEDIAKNFALEHPAANFIAHDKIKSFISNLQTPRNILLMVNAGDPVDHVIEELLPLLTKDDLIIDAGNSFYEDTKRRIDFLKPYSINFIGMGVSGGEEGALKGPSIMPGGAETAYLRVAKLIEQISAKDKHGKPCCTFIGPEGSGHFVKMVHNGIEYGEMQIIAEVYYLLRYYVGIDVGKIADIFEEWSTSGLNSYLLEITIDILRTSRDGELVLDTILDSASQKGTGGWSTSVALKLGIPLDTIVASVMARFMSAIPATRKEASNTYQTKQYEPKSIDIEQVKHAYMASRIINHAIGFDLLKGASDAYNWRLNLAEIARIWTAGCIIRSELMESLATLGKALDKNLILQSDIVSVLKKTKKDWSKVVAASLEAGCAIPVLSSGLNYFLNFTTGHSSANLIQAQRDYFGAHTYERIDRPRGNFFHTKW